MLLLKYNDKAPNFGAFLLSALALTNKCSQNVGNHDYYTYICAAINNRIFGTQHRDIFNLRIALWAK